MFTQIKPKEELSFTWKGPDQFAEIMNQPSSLTSVNIVFSRGADDVLIKLRHSGWGSTTKWDEARLWHGLMSFSANPGRQWLHCPLFLILHEGT